MAFIEVSNLSKTWRLGETEVTALRDVSFTVEKGEFLLIVGASGSGKSTLLNLLGGIDRPTRGEITVVGRRYTSMKDRELTLFRREEIGFVFQFFNLLPALTAVENVALPELIRGGRMSRCRARAVDALKAVGMAGRENFKPSRLSGGEQQRTAIARALMSNPSIILADEPTGNLDSENSLEILEILRRAKTDTGRTVVLVSHDPECRRYADRILRLKDGTITGEESHGRGGTF